MTLSNDLILSKLTVRIQSPGSSTIIGTGLLYSHPRLKERVYVLTAAHNLYKDSDSFTIPLNKVSINIYDPAKDAYSAIEHIINYELVSPDINQDTAVLVMDRNQVEQISGVLPVILAVRERQSVNTFSVKGFANATQGKELVSINPVWIQSMTEVSKFQLQLTEDYTGWSISGFSGSGIFLNVNDRLYLFGIFARFREEGKGKVIYCQYLDSVNELLDKKYLPLIAFSFLADYGLTLDFFNTHVEVAISNLGPRFNEELNFKLPIARHFNDIARDGQFKRKLLNAIDKWLVGRNFSYHAGKDTILAEIEEEFKALRKSVTTWMEGINWNADQKIEDQTIVQQLIVFNDKVENKRHELYDLRWEEEKKTIDQPKDYSYRPPYEDEINRLRDFRENNDTFLDAFESINIHLSNYPFLLIQGEAGSGKSHLLGDIANERKRNGLPTILLLGQLFKQGQSVWQNLVGQLNVSCSKDQLLSSLNSIGQQQGSRILILIDALNEGAGKDLWHNELAGFISEVKKFPFIGLVLTVRSTYFNVVIPSTVRSNNEITQVTHEGFKGNEYEALRLFCEHYGLQQPNFPILAPEFSNPLFLQLICQGIRSSGQKIFPQGFHGISTIFEYYLKAITDKLNHKRDEYNRRPDLISQAIQEMARACFEHQGSLPLQKAVILFDTKFPVHRHLLDDLIHENIFIQSLVHDYKTDTESEIIYFSYERFGDFYLAKELLEPFESPESVREAFKNKNTLGVLLEEGAWSNRGILEAMAILLPEKFNLEIFEVFDWAFDGQNENLLGNIDDWLNHYLLDSLKWRKPENINNEKISGWLNSDKFNIGQDTYYNAIIELTTLAGHPFNGDRLTRILNQFAMPERDAFWQQYLRFYTGKDDQGNAYPLKRLIDWAWLPGISEKIDTETARLTGQTLSWVLSSTDRTLRDQTTKAMVNLLEEWPDALLAILKRFQETDDLYILERLYAVAYGCTLRTSTDQSVQKIAQYVFDTVFKEGKPYVHILLRDYARNIIEYALYKRLDIVADISLIRPPYNTSMPDNIPTEAQLKIYEKDHDALGFKQTYGFYYNQIKHSVMDWDFGRYTVDSAFHDFHPVSFHLKKEYPEFLKTLTPKQKKFVKAYEKMLEAKFLLKRKKDSVISNLGQQSFDEMMAKTEKNLLEIKDFIEKELTADQYALFSNKMIYHLVNIQRSKDRQRNSFDTRPIKRWIVQRSFELGYNAESHGPYESSIESYNNRSGNKIERIGKKYQWIALHEILAMVADSHMIKDRWGSNKKYEYYQGAWQEFLRDIDPVFITKNKKGDNQDDEDQIEHTASDWWLDSPYTYWNIPESTWLKSLEDLPDPKHIIERTTKTGKSWLYLRTNVNWQEPKPIGKEKYKSKRKDIWYLIQGYIFHRKDQAKVIDWFPKQDFKGRWMPESHKANLSLFNRENYWAPASSENEKENWEKLEKADFKVMVSTSEAVGELSQDKSGAHFGYDMPCKLLFERMKLQYAPVDGNFKNELGDIVVTNTVNGGVLISKDHLLQFLSKNNLGIVWALLGEKRTLGDIANRNYNFYTTLSGAYFFEKNALSGTLSFSPDRE